MKKKNLILPLASLVVALSLASCGDGKEKTPADTVAPVITGNVDRTGEVSKSINLLEGVTALDDVDGDISSKITVSVEPAMTVNNGSVTPTEQGDYEVTYSVSDAAGNESKQYCTLTVNPALGEKELYKEFSFGAGANDDFALSVFDGCTNDTAVASLVKGNYHIEGNTHGEAWHIKFEGKTAVKADAEYEVIIDFTSTKTGTVTLEAYDYSSFNKTFDVTEGANSVSFKFYPTSDKEDQGYCLQLGNLATDFVVDISKVEVKETIGEDEWETIKSTHEFTADNLANHFWSDSTGTFTPSQDGSKAVMDITKGTTNPNCWEMWAVLGLGQKLEAGKYKISVDVVSNADTPAVEANLRTFNQEDTKAGAYGIELKANEKQTVTISANLTEALSNPGVTFQVGAIQEACQLEFSNIVIEKVMTEDKVIVENHEFTADNLANHFWSDSTGTFTPSQDGSKAVMDITNGTTNPNCWEMWAVLGLGQKLEANKTYKITVDLKSNADTPAFEANLRTFNLEDTKAGAYGIELKANETKTVELEVNLNETLNNPGLTFQLGAIQSACTIEFSNLTVTQLGGSKTVTSTTKTFGPAEFGTFNDGAHDAEGYLYTDGDKLVYEMTKIGLTDWYNKMYIPKVTLEANKIYTIVIEGKADKDISCAFFLNKLGSWDPRVNETIDFTTETQTFEFVTPKFAADLDFEILWQFGSDVNKAKGGAKVEFTSIKIMAQDVE